MPRRTTIPRPPNNDQVKQAIREAQKIWNDWRDVFEHTGCLNTNPILADSGRFRFFCKEWSVARTLRAQTSDGFRCWLRESQEFATALDDYTGCALDQLHTNVLQVRFGTRGGKRGVRSALSKVATFIRPASFTAWDKYACSGLNVVIGRSKSSSFASYAEYLSRFNDVWNGPHGERICEMINPIGEPIQAEPRFQRRILDLYLMIEGGYVEPGGGIKCCATPA